MAIGVAPIRSIKP